LCDHAAGRGGVILEAVQFFENMTFPQSVQRLAGSPSERIIAPKPKPKAEHFPKIGTLTTDWDLQALRYPPEQLHIYRVDLRE
jgi:hypothetical protein